MASDFDADISCLRHRDFSWSKLESVEFVRPDLGGQWQRLRFDGRRVRRLSNRMGGSASLRPANSTGMHTSGGVTNFTNTKTHKACLTCGRRVTFPIAATNTASTVANTAFESTSWTTTTGNTPYRLSPSMSFRSAFRSLGFSRV